ncbi:hypothetical protein ACFX10_021644 [Malus domestica]
MVKVRMNTADVAAEVKCLRRLIGMRCSNVYDLSPKLMNSSGVTESGECEKVFLLSESGVRLHTTLYVRGKSGTPSGFTLKLRKHIRTRRLEDVRQLGYDRIVLFQFGLGANVYYVILELYAQGNVILADSGFMVEVDLALSAHANARRWYELKKKQESKQEETVTAHEKAFKAAEKKTGLQLSQEKAVASISHLRKFHCFEKFNWFISSEHYLIISGRDAQQNEMIVERDMSKGDLYVHVELHGASSTVIKNHRPDQPVPPLTLNQAGCSTVCHSAAWDSKIVTSAWWVHPHQVSKTAPTGGVSDSWKFYDLWEEEFSFSTPSHYGLWVVILLGRKLLGLPSE